MGRFSLSPPRLEGDHVSLSKELPYREQAYDSYSDDASTGSDSSSSFDEDEPPHPIGFGRTRFSLSPPPKPVHLPSRFVLEESDDEMEDPALLSWGDSSPPEQSFPPLSSYINPDTAPPESLLRYSTRGHQHDDGDRERMDKLTHLLEAACVVQHDTDQWLSPSAKQRSQQQQQDVGQRMRALTNAANTELLSIQQKAMRERKRVDEEHGKVAELLKILLKRDEDAARQIILREQKDEEERKEAEKLRREQQAKETAEKQKLIEKQQQEENEKKERIKQAEEKKHKEQMAADKEVVARRKKEAEAKAKKMEYVAKANKLVAKLVELRKSVEPFESLRVPHVSKRRLNMKRVVRGKLNTLSHDAGKVMSIAKDVSNAILEARAQDEQMKQALQSGAAGDLTSEMARGKRYLLDLLASNVIVRVQAESFTGVKGDGFPLAAMLAAVSVDAKELVAILAAHIYTVCPMAIPSLPKPSHGSSEEDFAKTLGMGENETFERFLSRTEGTISIVADIMSSKPPNHVLLGGHKGAVDWLERFLSLLPSPPDTPLPLLTAPVLGSFLTGAGHMLANKYPEEFSKHLDVIMNDIIKRLDEGTIGQPSATRLKRLVEGGFDGFKNTLPPGAVPELYDGGELTSSEPSSATSNTAFSVGGAASNTASNPFGAGQSSGATSVGTSDSSNVASNASPFGNATSQFPQTNSFGSVAQSNAFGQSQNTDSNPSQFSSPSPFGSQPQNTSQMGGSSQFGAQKSEAMSSSDMAMSNTFGSSTATAFGSASQSASAFGGPSPSPFGMSSSSQSPFGGGGTTTTSNQFGSSSNNPAPFGGVGTSQPTTGFSGTSTPFGGGNTNPSPFTGGSTGQPLGGMANASPFGSGGGTTNNTPFGGTTPFGAGASNSGAFGGTSGQAFGGASGMQSTPFGSSSSQPTPFGGGVQSSPFGGSSNAAPASFGTPQASSFAGSNSGGGKSNNRPPCKFFAQGKCRYGANCRFSHETGGAGGGGTGTSFGSTSNMSSNPFGGPRR